MLTEWIFLIMWYDSILVEHWPFTVNALPTVFTFSDFFCTAEKTAYITYLIFLWLLWCLHIGINSYIFLLFPSEFIKQRRTGLHEFIQKIVTLPQLSNQWVHQSVFFFCASWTLLFMNSRADKSTRLMQIYDLLHDQNVLSMQIYQKSVCFFISCIFICSHVKLNSRGFNCLKWYSSDVRDFLQMDKSQNISDASDDDDEKVCHKPQRSQDHIDIIFTYYFIIFYYLHIYTE